MTILFLKNASFWQVFFYIQMAIFQRVSSTPSNVTHQEHVIQHLQWRGDPLCLWRHVYLGLPGIRAGIAGGGRDHNAAVWPTLAALVLPLSHRGWGVFTVIRLISDPPENCQLNVKKLQKIDIFSKKLPKIVFFPKKLQFFGKNDNFWIFF